MKAIYFLFSFLFPAILFSQPVQTDSVTVKVDTAAGLKDSTALLPDTAVKKDSAVVVTRLPVSYADVLERSLKQSHFLNAAGKPEAAVTSEMAKPGNELFFYFILCLLLFLALLRFFFERYFNNMFRVFFNTSLRQSQLTDQLLQAKQVSLFFNMLFAFSAGVYIYFLLNHFKLVPGYNQLLLAAICILSVAAIYFMKYLTLKFSGWLTGFKEAANTYLFIIFLINKILAILLIPFTVVIAFGADFLKQPAVLVSLLLIGLMFLLRFLRSYGLLRKDIKVSRFHFFIYIAAIEVLPLLLIYKTLVILLSKNL